MQPVAPRRHALLTAAALSLETGLTDATLLMFDKLMGSLSRKAERRSQEKAAKSAHDLQSRRSASFGASGGLSSSRVARLIARPTNCAPSSNCGIGCAPAISGSTAAASIRTSRAT